MAVTIKSVAVSSPAYKKGIRDGDVLVSVNGHAINDVLDYRFRITESRVRVVFTRGGEERVAEIKKPVYDDIGLEFETFLMDSKMRCRNKCIFCFIDQNPPGMRDSIYFKDDDTRLSFFMGNYVTLTNVDYGELERLIEMKISPINVSVHSTDPELRVKLLGNRFAGDILEKIKFLADSGKVRMNCQIVSCRNVNDGEALEKTVNDLAAFYPRVESIAVVPAGLTKWRDGLYPLEAYDESSARGVTEITERLGDGFLKTLGTRLVYASDEFYIIANKPLPPYEFYEDFDQLDNGVGLIRSAERDIKDELEFVSEDAGEKAGKKDLKYVLITGKASEEFMRGVAADVCKVFKNVRISVVGAVNRFFGETVTVAGLLTGSDYIGAFEDFREAFEGSDGVMIPAVSLRSERDLFLDGMSPEELSEKIGLPVYPIENGADIVSFVRQAVENQE